jgi:F0F1-type ATP synthase membrane subunit b/b'
VEEHIDWLMGVILPYANFIIFIALAVFFFRKPAAAAAASKREDYAKLLREATAAREQAVARLDELKARQAKLDQEIAEIKTMSRQAAEQEAAKIVSDAERLAAHLREEARRIADAEVQKARNDLRQEIVAAVREGVTKKIASEVKTDAHLSLVRKQIGELNTIQAKG